MASGQGGREWVRGETTRCAFCLQPVDASSRTPCRRCRALYHRDCWKANDYRCAVYGCERVAPPASPRVPATTRSTPGGLNWLVIGLLLVMGINLARVASNWGVRPQFERVRISADPWLAADASVQTAQNLIEEIQPLLVDLEEQTLPPEDPESRWELMREVESAVRRLARARGILLEFRVPADARLFQETSHAWERLQRARIELYRTRE